ncbi:hypothetical protein AAFF_G00062560 [Aldrovandia affinis]|uniref:Uncharacterized protein n=1 Tax=Aldrovandia affinis TaxID=143900 RepID=A0AAD7RZH9_9TELE|nr:hypothetical protein AAFF_G00062560 [Aldrovandia affinis]
MRAAISQRYRPALRRARKRKWADHTSGFNLTAAGATVLCVHRASSEPLVGGSRVVGPASRAPALGHAVYPARVCPFQATLTASRGRPSLRRSRRPTTSGLPEQWLSSEQSSS